MSHEGRVIQLRESPLVSMLLHFYGEFPEVSRKVIDDIVIESKCDATTAEHLIRTHELGIAPTERRDSGGSLNDWYSESAPQEDIARPLRELKVYRLDTDAPNSSIP